MEQNEIIEGMAVEEAVVTQRGGILSLVIKIAKHIVKVGVPAVGGYMLGKWHAKKTRDESESSDYETEDYEDITDDDENPVDSDVE